MAITQLNMHRLYQIVFLIVLTAFSAACKKKVDIVKYVDEDGSESSKRLQFEDEYLSGLRYVVLGKESEALNKFDKALKVYPNHPAVLYQKAKIHEGKRLLPEALGSMETAVKGDPENRWYLEYTASLYQRLERYADAAKMYENLVKVYPDSPENYFHLANMYLYANKLKEATQVYDRLETKMGFNEEITQQQYKIYMQLKDYPNARKQIEKLMQAKPDEVSYYGMMASLYRQDGKMNKAIEVLEELRSKHQNDPTLALTLYDYYKENNMPDKANAALRDAFASPELNIDHKINIMISYYGQSEKNIAMRKDAYELLEALVEAHPQDPKGYAMYGDFLIRENRIQEAEKQYKSSVALDKSRWLVWNQLLFIQLQIGDIDTLLKYSNQALELFPNQPLVYFFKGVGLFQNSNYKDAIPVLEQGQAMVFDNKELLIQFFAHLGDAYYKEKDYQNSFLSYERALKLDSENDYVLNNYAYFLSLTKENLDQAEKMAASTVSRNPTSSTYLDTYGWVLFQMEKYEESAKVLDKALKNGGNQFGEILEHYGDAMFKLGNTEKAMQYWKKAQEKGGASDNIGRKIESSTYFE